VAEGGTGGNGSALGNTVKTWVVVKAARLAFGGAHGVLTYWVGALR
jgi:hypothetical protein